MLQLLKSFLILLIITAIVVATFLGYQFHRFQQLPLNIGENPEPFLIEKGSSIRNVANSMADKGYINDPLMFIALARVIDPEKTIKAGEYRILEGSTPVELLNQFRRGNSLQYSFTIIEGWTFRELLQQLAQDKVLLQTIDNLSTPEIMAKISFADEHPEGRFLPDTYLFPRGTTDIEFLKRAYASMQKLLEEEWQNRESGLPLQSPYAALTLASIVEKETGVARERPQIAAVFLSRLRKKMRLQTDPTVIYGLGESFDGNIRYRDLRADTPYNTYLRGGLTPTPIAMPGRESIHAVLHPDETDALYFVSKGDGTHYFSETLEEHNQAVSKYQLKGKKPKRQAEPG